MRALTVGLYMNVLSSAFCLQQAGRRADGSLVD